MRNGTTIGRIRWTYFALTGLFWFSTAMLAPLYVIFLMKRGLTLGDVGLWAGTNTAAVLLLELPTGGLADAWGRGRTYAAANGIISVSLLLMALVPGRSVLFIGAALFGAGRALSSGSLDAWFIDSLKAEAPETDIEKELGPAGAVSLAALAAGSLLGSVLPGLAGRWGGPDGARAVALPLIADSLLKAVLAIATLVLIREDRRRESGARPLISSLKAFPDISTAVKRVIASDPRIRRLLAAGTVLALASGSLETFWQPRFLDITGRESGVVFGLVLSGGFLAAAAGSLVVPGMTKRLGGRRHLTALLGTVAAAAALGLLASVGKALPTALMLALCYLFLEAAGLPRKAMLNDAIPSEIRATMLSVDSLALYVGFSGIVLLGFLAQKSGIPVVWRLVAGVSFAGSWLYTGLGRKEKDGAQNPGRIDGRAAEGSDSCRGMV